MASSRSLSDSSLDEQDDPGHSHELGGNSNFAFQSQQMTANFDGDAELSVQPHSEFSLPGIASIQAGLPQLPPSRPLRSPSELLAASFSASQQHHHTHNLYMKNPLVVHQSPLSSSHLNPTPYSLPFSYNPQQQPISSVVYSPISQPPTVMNLLRCPFVECEKKAWFRGFALKEDYDFHLSLHRCQWTVISQDGAKFASCRFIPSSTDEAVSHLEKHIENDQLPQIRAADNTSQVPGEARRTMYFCPIQTCSSDSYCRKGSTNKAHLLQHIRKHLGL